MSLDETRLFILDRLSEMVEELADDETFLEFLQKDLEDSELDTNLNKIKGVINEVSQEIATL